MKNIPKIVHFCWTKNSPISLLQVLSVISFQKYNPDWRIIIHVIQQTPDQIGKNTFVPDYKGKDFFHVLEALDYVIFDEVDLLKEGIGLDKHGILVSDILRLKWLYEIGGVYSDFDMLWLKPMKEFVNIDCLGDPNDFETTVCFYEYTQGHHNASNIVSEPGGEFLRFLLNFQKKIKPPYSHQAFNSEMLNFCFPDLDRVLINFPRINAINYKTFYPYSIYNLKALYEETRLELIDNTVMGVHWFNGHEMSRKYVDSNLGAFKTKCSMTEILKKEGYLYEEYS